MSGGDPFTLASILGMLGNDEGGEGEDATVAGVA
jgi:hypothetical protein